MHVSVDAQTLGYADFILAVAADGEAVQATRIGLKRLIGVVHVVGTMLPLRFRWRICLVSLESAFLSRK